MAQALRNIYKSELYKIKHTKLFWGLFCCLIVMAVWKIITDILMPSKEAAALASGISTGYVNVSIGTVDLIVIAVLVCLTLGNDHSTGSVRQISSKGYLRSQILLGKILAYTFLSIIMIVGYRVLSCIEFSVRYGITNKASVVSPVRVIIFTLGLICFSFLAVTLDVLLTMAVKTTSSFCISLVVVFAGDIVVMLSSFLLNKYLHAGKVSEFVVDYWFMNMARDMGSKDIGNVAQVRYLVAMLIIGVALFFITAFQYKNNDVA